jgi:hypothetical protein
LGHAVKDAEGFFADVLFVPAIFAFIEGAAGFARRAQPGIAAPAFISGFLVEF